MAKPKSRPGMEQETTNSEFDFNNWVLKKVISRNNYLRAFAATCLALMCMLVYEQVVAQYALLCFALVGIHGLARGICRDFAVLVFYRRAPTARQLSIVAQKPDWPEKRGRLLTFPCRVSSRDPAWAAFCQPVPAQDPRNAMRTIQARFEQNALAQLGDSVRCCRLKRHYDDYPQGDHICPLPGDRSRDSGSDSAQSFCFVQRRQRRFVPYYLVAYVHVFTDHGMNVKAKIYLQGFGLSTWLEADDERLRSHFLGSELITLWHEALASFEERSTQTQPGPMRSSGVSRSPGAFQPEVQRNQGGQEEGRRNR